MKPAAPMLTRSPMARAEAREQARVEPGLAAAGERVGLARGREGRVGDLEPAAERIARPDRADRGERGVFAEEHDAREVTVRAVAMPRSVASAS